MDLLRCGTLTLQMLSTALPVWAEVPQSPFRDSDRLAISSDGNSRTEVLVGDKVINPEGGFRPVGDVLTLDPDDIPGTPLGLCMIAKAGLQDRVVHTHYNCGWLPRDIGKMVRPNRMRLAVEKSLPLTLGPSATETTFDAWGQQHETIDHLAEQIDQSSPDSHLYIILAGPADIVYRAVAASEEEKRPFVWIVSHHPWNENTRLLAKQRILDDLKRDFPTVQHLRIDDQNKDLNTKGKASWKERGDREHPIFDPWRWLSQPEGKDLYGLQQALDQIFESMVEYRVPDASDAGMIWWTLKLHPTNAAADGKSASYVTIADLKAYFSRQN